MISAGSFTSFAQSDSMFAVVTYDFKHMDDTTQPDFPRTNSMGLCIGKQISCYLDYDQFRALMSILNDVRTNGEMKANIQKRLMVHSIFKDIPNDRLTYIAPAGLNAYIMEESIPVIKWEVLPETKDIKGYPCQKASCSFRGRNYEAWFCAQLPYSNGPWKLGGLPGLILEAYDLKKEVMFSFVSFENAADIPRFTIPTHFEKITAKAYQQYRDATNKDSNAMLGASKASGGTVLAGKPAPGTPERHQKILNNPIEKTGQ